jgi:hypothetical protein
LHHCGVFRAGSGYVFHSGSIETKILAADVPAAFIVTDYSHKYIRRPPEGLSMCRLSSGCPGDITAKSGPKEAERKPGKDGKE